MIVHYLKCFKNADIWPQVVNFLKANIDELENGNVSAYTTIA